MKIAEITGEKFVQQGLSRGSIAHAVRDVDLGMSNMYPKLRRSGMQELNRKLNNEEWTIVDLPIRKLTATQNNVNLDFRQAAANRRSTDTDNYLYPCIVHFEDNYFIFDGHHRVADAAAEGKQIIRCRLVDMNPPQHDPRQLSMPVYHEAKHLPGPQVAGSGKDFRQNPGVNHSSGKIPGKVAGSGKPMKVKPGFVG